MPRSPKAVKATAPTPWPSMAWMVGVWNSELVWHFLKFNSNQFEFFCQNLLFILFCLQRAGPSFVWCCEMPQTFSFGSRHYCNILQPLEAWYAKLIFSENSKMLPYKADLVSSVRVCQRTCLQYLRSAWFRTWCVPQMVSTVGASRK